jgi:inorganic pyrophosphatase/exopolyphosphatase
MATETINKEFRELMEESKQLREQALSILKKDGKEYHLSEWLTVKRYCEKFGIANTQTVTNWIKRGIIPPENVIVLEEFNDLRLIKAVPYHE